MIVFLENPYKIDITLNLLLSYLELKMDVIMQRVKKFLSKLFFTLIFIISILFILIIIQLVFHPFSVILSQISEWIINANKTLSSELIAGISIGTVIFVLLMFFFPLMHKGVNRKRYWSSIQKGLITSFVFYISQLFYRYAETIGRFYFLIALFIVIIITLILIEIITLSMREEKEIELRTDLIAAIVSGLIFGILLKLFMIGLNLVEHLLPFMPKE